MRSEARLDSALFQLTPTRTRCDLVIIANGKKEKLASGLLTPFLAHLKTAQDQIAKGGYSITLEPDPEIDATWFTKGTVERFVRFVSTPEVLERVTTIESEILQIENAIAVQGSDNLAIAVDEHQTKMVENVDGIKSSVDTEAGKEIVLYKPGSEPNPPDSNGSATKENSKVQLLKVLEARKMVLRKEQGMAFARAAAAGFDMDNMVDLIPFAENFGAGRLKEACLRFMDLWKKKHETGQWLEVEAVEAMSTRSEFSTLNASGIIFTADSMIQKDHGDVQSVSGGDMGTDSNGKSDKQTSADPKVALGQQEYFQGQFQHPAYPQWPMHPPAGPMFQPYPVQGMPYYQNYPGSIPYFHPPYPPTEDPRFNSSCRKASKRHSMDSKDIESETWERSTRSQDDSDEDISDAEKEVSHGHKSHKRVGRSGKKKSGVVVIRNLNYIASKKHGARDSESDPQSASESEAEEGSEDVRVSKHKNSARISKKEDHQTKPEYSDAYGNDKDTYRDEADSGNWQAFQSFLLQAEGKSRKVDEDMFMGEKEPPSKKKQSKGEADPIVPPEREFGDLNDRRMVEFDSANGKASRMKQAAADDQLLVTSNRRDAIDHQFKEIDSVGGAYKQMSSDEFMIYGEEKQFNVRSYSDPLVDNTNEHAGNAPKSSSYNITDESFLLPYRSESHEVGADSITVIDMDSEIPTAPLKTEESCDNAKNQLFYEPEDLSMVPDRGMENLSMGYDPAMDYDFEIPIGNTVKDEVSDHEDHENPSTSTKEEPTKSDKKNLKASNDNMEKRRKEALAKKVTSSRLNSLTEAQRRADKLRSYKVDLQKMKKEREEEELKRLEGLKKERQKRIAARSGSTTTQSPSSPKQAKVHVATKQPIPSKGSKFNDADPISSPFRKLPTIASSNESSDPLKATKSSRLNGTSHGLTRSASLLPEIKKESNGHVPETKTESIRLKRLSEPKASSVHTASSMKSSTMEQVPKRGMPDESHKKVTEIIQLDKSKSEALPEIRIKAKSLSERVENGTASEEQMEKGIGNSPSLVSESIGRKSTNDKLPSNTDDNPVIEKTVVMLEDNVVAAPTVQKLDDIISTKEKSHGDGIVTAYTPPSSIATGQVENSSEGKMDEHQSSYEVVVPCSRNGPSKLTDTKSTIEPYDTPYARQTSLQDLVSTDIDYDGDLSAREPEMVAIHAENTTTQGFSFENSGLGFSSENSSLGDQYHETHDKPRSKEAKGLRKLLKFGRRSHSSASGEGNLDSDVSSVDDHTVAVGSSNDVSRSFSLLSPFRSKNSEKKLAA